MFEMKLKSLDKYGMTIWLIITAAIVADYRHYNPNRVDYIKAVRNTLGIGLKEAKDYADVVRALAADTTIYVGDLVSDDPLSVCMANISKANTDEQ